MNVTRLNVLVGLGLAATLGFSQQKPSVPKGWGLVSTHSPAISFCLPEGWNWADLTLNGGSAPVTTMLVLQARGPKTKGAGRARDGVLVTATPPSGLPISQDNLKPVTESLQRVMPNGTIVKQGVVDIAGEKGYLVHMQVVIQVDPDTKRTVDQYTYVVPGKKYDFHIAFTFISGTSGFDELQAKAMSTLVLKD